MKQHVAGLLVLQLGCSRFSIQAPAFWWWPGSSGRAVESCLTHPVHTKRAGVVLSGFCDPTCQGHEACDLCSSERSAWFLFDALHKRASEARHPWVM